MDPRWCGPRLSMIWTFGMSEQWDIFIALKLSSQVWSRRSYPAERCKERSVTSERLVRIREKKKTRGVPNRLLPFFFSIDLFGGENWARHRTGLYCENFMTCFVLIHTVSSRSLARKLRVQLKVREHRLISRYFKAFVKTSSVAEGGSNDLSENKNQRRNPK